MRARRCIERWLPFALLAVAGCAGDPSAGALGDTGRSDAGKADSSRDAAVPDVAGDARPGAPRGEDASTPPDAAATFDAPSHASGDKSDAGTMPETDGSGATMQALHVNVLAIGEGGEDQHGPFVRAALLWLDKLAAEGSLTYEYVETPDTVTDAMLNRYGLILQLNYPPFGWNRTAQAAFEKYLTEGKGGWVGLHHASLYGPEVQPANEKPWVWFYNLLGQINFENYIASFAEATVRLEEPAHSIFEGVPRAFQVTKDEWYTWDKSPRPHVRVLANVDESSYVPSSNIKMGDHPVVWTNEAYKGKNLYIFMGHHPNLFENSAYMTLLRNAIFWAATPMK
jgi:uncharacterized protein